MKLGFLLGYSGKHIHIPLDLVKQAESMGYDSVWTAEAYGNDAVTSATWVLANTTKIRVGTAIMQMSARTPAATAMAALTLDHLSGGRFILGIGASGPQVVEGWYGRPYPRPLERTREYVTILREIIAREGPVEFHGRHHDLPYTGEDGTGLGKALKSTVHPLRDRIPIFLAAEGPKNVALSAEICDGWLPLFFSPREDAFYRQCLEDGFSASGDRERAESFEVAATVTVIPGEDVEACADLVRPHLALYAGGMGARGANFHFEVFARMGYESVAEEVQQLYLAGRKEDAARAIPLEMVEDVALVGPIDKIRSEIPRWRDTCLTTVLLSGPASSLSSMAALFTD